MERLLLGLDGSRILHRRRRDVDEFAGSELRGRHVRGRTGDARVRSNELCERSRGCVQRGRHEVLLRRDLVQRLRGAENELRRVGRPLRRARARRSELCRVSAGLPRHHPGRPRTSRSELPRSIPGQGDDRGRSPRPRRSKATCTSAGRSSPGSGESRIYFARSTDEGASFGNKIQSGSASPARDATSPSSPTATST